MYGNTNNMHVYAHNRTGLVVGPRLLSCFGLSEVLRCGGVLVSTRALKVEEHAGAHEVLVKTCKIVAGKPNYALAA